MEQFTGKVWLLGDDIDTDIIMPTEYLALKTVNDMRPYAFSPLRPELAAQIAPGDIIVAGNSAAALPGNRLRRSSRPWGSAASSPAPTRAFFSATRSTTGFS